MARIRMTMGERIPQVCIICGEDAPVVAQESFWAPVIPEIRPLLRFLVPISERPRFFVKETVQTVPYCKQHEYELDRIARRLGGELTLSLRPGNPIALAVELTREGWPRVPAGV